MKRKGGFCIVCWIVACTVGCGDKTNVFPKATLESALKGNIPAFISIDNIEMETNVDATGKGKVNFKATLSPKEDLYRVDRKVNGDPVVTLLRITQRAGSKSYVYGVAEVSKIVDLWTIDNVKVQSGVQQFGDPIGSFGPDNYVTGSPEADEALKLQIENAKTEQRKKEEALAEQARQEAELRDQQERREREAREKIAKLQEEERIRRQETRLREEQRRLEQAREQQLAEKQRKAELEEQRQKILLASAPGARYSGTISNHLGQQERIVMQFKNRNNSAVEVVFSSPDDKRKSRIFDGEIVFEPRIEIQLKSTNEVYPPPNFRGNKEEGSSWYFYYKTRHSSLAPPIIEITLSLTESGGFEGKGKFYTLELHPASAAKANKESSEKKSK